ncbi:cation efflux system protein CusC precursor [mine drainage metagenome]|uniref:Cation efflux system protein CusC n=1 Tax=mine drainage metagenome TaxID=410659 RepID=A0A1J5QU79_9ZZZZ
MRFSSLTIVLPTLALAACASYVPRPLPEHVDQPRSAAAISIDPASLPFRNLSTHLFDPANGLDSTEVAMLAVANNPQLKEMRDALGIARAQAFAAGLLPDPQLGASFDHPTNGTAGNSNGFSVSPSYDVSALLLRSSRVGAAGANLRRVNLELLWQEWQVVSQARLLFTRLRAQQALLDQARAERKLLAGRYRSSRRALAAGNVTLDHASADLAALQQVERRSNELERSRLRDRAALDRLLGLAADAPLDLVGEPAPIEIDAAGVRADLAQRLKQRPDLQALRAGYRSQEEKFRGAILAQFPALNIGLTRARDTSGLYTVGFGLSLSLPIFNANRGNIAIARATRSKLYDEYQDRLNSAYGEVAVALENLPLLQAQLQRSRRGVIELKSVARRARAAVQAGNMSAPDYARLQSAALDKRSEAIELQEALTEQRIALETLLGPELPGQNRSKQ